jgi:hypothetical protein
MLTTTTQLHSLLQALATGDAAEAIEDAYEAAYPVSYDPASDTLVQTEDN